MKGINEKTHYTIRTWPLYHHKLNRVILVALYSMGTWLTRKLVNVLNRGYGPIHAQQLIGSRHLFLKNVYIEIKWMICIVCVETNLHSNSMHFLSNFRRYQNECHHRRLSFHMDKMHEPKHFQGHQTEMRLHDSRIRRQPEYQRRVGKRVEIAAPSILTIVRRLVPFHWPLAVHQLLVTNFQYYYRWRY